MLVPARAPRAGAGLSVRASVGLPLRWRGRSRWRRSLGRCPWSRRTRPPRAKRNREAEAVAAAPPADDDTARRRAASAAGYRAPSDAAPVVKRLAYDAFVDARAAPRAIPRTSSGRRGASGPASPRRTHEAVEGRLFPTSATYVRRRGAAVSLVASYPTTALRPPAPPPRGRTIHLPSIFAMPSTDHVVPRLARPAAAARRSKWV